MKNMTLNKTKTAIAIALLASGVAANAAQSTKASNTGSIVNTRHNLTQSYLSPQGVGTMDWFRNNYEEVCVYCHTPHGANTTISAPLWNRTNKATTYLPYNSVSLINPPDSSTYKPGPNSLTCLSCHDGTVAIDSIINMPGSGGYKQSQMTSVDKSFLSSWSNPSGNATYAHFSLDKEPGGPANTGCTWCHSQSGMSSYSPVPDFTAFVIGTDLRNDHPVGIRYPSTGPGVDFRSTNDWKEYKTIKFIDERNDELSKDDIRIYSYDGGSTHQVECASCHDPHGVPSAGEGSKFIPTFLRKTNSGSAVCVTCHVK